MDLLSKGINGYPNSEYSKQTSRLLNTNDWSLGICKISSMQFAILLRKLQIGLIHDQEMRPAFRTCKLVNVWKRPTQGRRRHRRRRRSHCGSCEMSKNSFLIFNQSSLFILPQWRWRHFKNCKFEMSNFFGNNSLSSPFMRKALVLSYARHFPEWMRPNKEELDYQIYSCAIV